MIFKKSLDLLDVVPLLVPVAVPESEAKVAGKLRYWKEKDGRFWARMAVPAPVRRIIGKSEIIEPLGGDRRAAIKAHPAAVARLQAQIAVAEAQLAGIPAPEALTAQVTTADFARAVWDRYNDALARDDERRAHLPGDAEIEAATERAVERVTQEGIDLKDPAAMLDVALDVQVLKEAASFDANARKVKLDALRDHLAQGEMALIAHEVDDYLDQNRLLVQRGSPDWASLARRMMRGEIEALQRTLERDRGDYSGQPSDPLVRPATSAKREVAKPGETIMEVFEKFARENPRRVAPDRIDQMRRDIGIFVECVGASFPVHAIDRVAVRDWKALLIQYPLRANEVTAFQGMNMRQIVKANERLKRPVLSDRTVNRYLSSLGAFCNWLEVNGYLDRNPVSGMALPKEKQSKTLPFTTDQMNKLFRSPLFTGAETDDDRRWSRIARPGSVLIRDYRYWVPLIMLFTGARNGEIGQLATSDMREMHGHWVFHITTEGEKTDAGKSVKTEGSMRIVPVHPELVRLGILDYHAQRVEAGDKQLFPGAKRNERGQMMADFSREFGKYLTRIGLREGRGLSLYSFRHGAADALRRAGYLDAQFGFILGHVEASMTGRYGIMPQGMLKQRVELVNAITYPGLKLDHLIP